MNVFLKFCFYHYFLPIIFIAAIVIPVALKQYNLPEPVLENAYRNEITSYNWVNTLDSVNGFILGASTLRYGLSASRLKTNDSLWVNFSMDARDPLVCYLLLKQYYASKKPSVILFGLDPWIFSKRYYINEEKIMYLDLNAHETYSFLKLDKSVFFTKFRKLFDLYLSGNKKIKNDDSFTVPQDYGSVKLTEKAKNFDEIHNDWFEINKFHWSEIEFEYLLRIKDFCHKNNVKLVFIISPKRKDFRVWSETAFKHEHQEWWNKINDVIGGEYIIGKYSTLDAQNQDSVFVEAFHLNKNGQKEFSVFVRNSLKSPGVITRDYSIF